MMVFDWNTYVSNELVKSLAILFNIWRFINEVTLIVMTQAIATVI